MQLSQRVLELRESSTLAVTAKAAALRAAGADVVILGAGEPDFDTPEPIRRAATAALERGQTRYTATAGDAAARRAIAEKLRGENGLACEAEDIVITVGAKHAIYLALQCLLDPGAGQEVLLPTPAWVSYRPLIELAGGRCVEVPSSIEDRFAIDLERLERSITPRTVGLVVNSPSNPCGVVTAPTHVESLAAVLRRHPALWIISDEIYEKLIFPEVTPGLRHRSPGSLEGLRDRTITVNGLSKAYAMTGWRIGYLAAPHGSGIAAGVAKLQGQMTNNITSFVYPAIVEALEHGADAVEAMRRTFARRAQLVAALLDGIPGVETVPPDGAFYAFPRIRACLGRTTAGGRPLASAGAFAAALLDEAQVAVVPGEDFGTCAAEHVRISFATTESELERGVARIAAFVAGLTPPVGERVAERSAPVEPMKEGIRSG
ncbi:MAG TPA: pyridoxal phosphate-dependent aminotransferase [Phycisphaerales bacterium]|nr:pyridoxal phosphate-dependent aminotransferase [Phycisphaerales bacterium]HMP35828.1 pyridoxal phosphate-dependent aminotransferase [Phycisphaerales bacterium]